ncbi:hypothetical protein CDD80_3204 [Ophiocordyceps camponoti-rufipedis]|uniref:Zinc/iron permease n=1 Tax=Ophiocordyceps camponoti-rufipedis TaxID=2004952 RepID=A0A2C5Z319_9HYPO|nr:hypothetical protein CDD80_3204 [Ophiocordyceps camponoti-rufipedis]
MLAALALVAGCGLVAGLETTSAGLMARQAPGPTPAPTAAAAGAVETVTGCSMRGSQLICTASGTDFLIHSTPTQTTALPAQFTGCHHHGSEMFCIAPDGDEVEVGPANEPAGEHHDHDHHDHDHHGSGGRNCHFHAGVEHCVGGSEEEESQPQCAGVKREYNVGLRVGLLFAILATSALGVFGPILLQRLLPRKLSLAFIVLKQFGTGIIISTAFVHLYTHASLMFGNKCLGELGYEATTSAILMAGLVLSFLVEYAGRRIVSAKVRSSSEQKDSALLSTEVVSILVMEAGILFHSLLIGLTLVVAGDSFFLTLFVVILFHQVFEGLALGTRIATIGSDIPDSVNAANGSASSLGGEKTRANSDPDEGAVDHRDDSAVTPKPVVGLSMKKKLGLAALFAFITPIGMAIGIGVLQKFNGNDKSTLIAIGTLDALSAGILAWVGIVEMWAADWMAGGVGHGHGGELADANWLTVALSGSALFAGMALMSLLGKWA